MRAFLASIPLLFVLVPTLAATVILPAEFREIVSGSEIIVHGRVIDVRSEWTADRSRIDSYVTVESATNFRGASERTLTFRTPGGQAGRYKNVMVGAPEFRVGDEAVLFLTRADGVTQVFGLNQGLFRVRVDSRTGRRMVVRQPLIGNPTGAKRVVRGDRTRRPMTLDAFSAEIRAAVGAAR